MNVLGLDLGTQTGACWNSSEKLFVESWQLATLKELKLAKKERFDRRKDPRILALYRRLLYVRDNYKPDVVAFEDVQFASYTQQVQLWSSLRAMVWFVFREHFIDCVPVGTLKKFATGKGDADKNAMIRFAKASVGTFNNPSTINFPDDNAADAYWIWKWAGYTFARLKTK